MRPTDFLFYFQPNTTVAGGAGIVTTWTLPLLAPYQDIFIMGMMASSSIGPAAGTVRQSVPTQVTLQSSPAGQLVTDSMPDSNNSGVWAATPSIIFDFPNGVTEVECKLTLKAGTQYQFKVLTFASVVLNDNIFQNFGLFVIPKSVS